MCHVRIILVVLAFAAILAVCVSILSALSIWLDRRYGAWAAWTLLGVVCVVSLVGVAWQIPCSESVL